MERAGRSLERAGGIGALELEEQPAGSALKARHLHERRFADEVEDRGHGYLALRGDVRRQCCEA